VDGVAPLVLEIAPNALGHLPLLMSLDQLPPLQLEVPEEHLLLVLLLPRQLPHLRMELQLQRELELGEESLRGEGRSEEEQVVAWDALDSEAALIGGDEAFVFP